MIRAWDPGPAEARPGALRTFHHRDFDAAALAAARAGRRVAVCLPARNEAAPWAPSCERPRRADPWPAAGVDLVDEIVVVDDGSTTTPRRWPGRAGARVVAAGTAGGGKGQAMAVALDETDADLLVFLDADVENFGAPLRDRAARAPLLDPGPDDPTWPW